MICPKCGAAVQPDANFCQKCGFNFGAIPQVERIEIPIPLPEPEEETVVGQQVTFQTTPQPQIIVERSSNTALYVLFGAALFLSAIALAFFAYVYFNPRPATKVAQTTNANANANLEKPSPTPTPTPDYEDWKNSIAPETQRLTLLDEQFDVQPEAHRAVRFQILSEVKSARLVGGLRTTGGAVNFYVYEADDYDDFPNTDAKPVQFEQTRNKKINLRLEPGDYVAVFENPPGTTKPVNVASELLLVYD